MLLLKIPETHDLVLEFDSEPSRKRLLTRLDSLKPTELVPAFREELLARAETKERRQRKLEHFFREAYTLTFGIK